MLTVSTSRSRSISAFTNIWFDGETCNVCWPIIKRKGWPTTKKTIGGI